MLDVAVFSHQNPNGGQQLHSSCVGRAPLALPAASVAAATESKLGLATPLRVARLTYPQIPAHVPAADAMHYVRRCYHGCNRCHLSETRNTVVDIEGSVDAKVLLLGGSPDQYANMMGLPYSGKPGLLQKEILNHVGVDPINDVCWATIIGCRSAAHFQRDRAPSSAELVACSERITMLLRAIRPRVVVCLGAAAASYFWASPPPRWSWHRMVPTDATDDWVMAGYAHPPDYLVRVIGAPSMYREYAASKTFYGIVRDQLPTLTKVNTWRFMPQYLSGVQAGELEIGHVT